MASKLSSIRSRDLIRRTFGCVGFSMIAHVAVLASLIFMHREGVFTEPARGAKTPKPTSTSLVDSIPHPGERAPVHEVILANENDNSATAVAVPPQEKTAVAETQHMTSPESEEKNPTPTTPISKAAKLPKRAQGVAIKSQPKVKKISFPAAAQPASQIAVQPESPVEAPSERAHDSVASSDLMPGNEFQPHSIADTEPKNKNIPEQLSPIIAEEPIETTHDLANKSDETEAPVESSSLAASAPAPAAKMSESKPEESTPKAPVVVAAVSRKPTPAPISAPKATTSKNPTESLIVKPGSAINGIPNDKSDGVASATATNAGGAKGGNNLDGPIIDASLRKPVSGPLPKYSQQDRLLRREGLAVVVGHVNTNGNVSGVYIDRSSGSRDMDQAAMESFKLWKFVPGPEAKVRKSFQFSLKGDAQVGYARLKR